MNAQSLLANLALLLGERQEDIQTLRAQLSAAIIENEELTERLREYEPDDEDVTDTTDVTGEGGGSHASSDSHH